MIIFTVWCNHCDDLIRRTHFQFIWWLMLERISVIMLFFLGCDWPKDATGSRKTLSCARKTWMTLVTYDSSSRVKQSCQGSECCIPPPPFSYLSYVGQKSRSKMCPYCHLLQPHKSLKQMQRCCYWQHYMYAIKQTAIKRPTTNETVSDRGQACIYLILNRYQN